MKKPKKSLSERPPGADYLRVLEWSDEDQLFLGSAPPLVGRCCHGKTATEAARELEEVIAMLIEQAERDGERLPTASAGRNYSGKFVLRINPELHEALAVKALKDGRSLNEHVGRLLQAA
ncbi:MAG TPA: toxin-antitoxin system HicB family antitoxin [Verrucomicrobiota bacterium]|nr:toxin-antitoxin system HicB family antitoxin [Verrucomicrobiales bacterium]HRI11572.1 toxin-antitoxin system HicB family antitoxin [Verrucomicrobiota bacterium]